jgi:hypothetical protein
MEELERTTRRPIKLGRTSHILNIIYHQNILIIGTIVYAGYPEAKEISAVDEKFENY